MTHKKLTAVLKKALCVLLSICVFAGTACVAAAKEKAIAGNEEIVRVGYYDGNIAFQSGFSDGERKSGYAYEYYQEVAKYTGWKYSYVYGSWAEIYQMLLDGEIDIAAGVSKTESRSEKMLFPTNVMGSELYYVCIPSSSEEITSDPHSLDGKTIGVGENSYMLTLFEAYVEEKGIDCTIKTYNGHYPAEKALKAGEVDGIVITDNYMIEGVKPVINVGGSDYYFAVSRSRTDILTKLNNAQDRILAASPYYNSTLQQKYFYKNVLTQALTEPETTWLKEKGKLVLGCLEDFLPYCGTNSETGETKGLVKTLARKISDFIGIPVSFVSFGTYDEMLSALQKKTIDAAFPVYGDIWLSEREHIVQTTQVYEELGMVAYNGEYGEGTFERIAFAGTGTIGSGYIEQLFPNAEVVEYKNLEACFSALEAKKVSSIIDSRSVLSRYFTAKYGFNGFFNTAYINKAVTFSLAAAAGETELISILNKAVGNIEQSLVSDTLTRETYSEISYSLNDLIRRNPMEASLIVGAAFVFVAFWFTIYYIRSRRSAKLLFEEKEKTEAVNADLMKQIQITKAWQDASETDALTGLLNRGGGEKRMKELLDAGTPGLFCIFDIDDFKHINDIYGHSTGDEALKTIADCMKNVFRGSDVLIRFGGDEFAIFAPEIAAKPEAENCITRLMRSITEAEVPGMESQSLGVSLGAMLCKEKTSFRTVYRKCDSALYRCKGNGNKKYQILDADGEDSSAAFDDSQEGNPQAGDYNTASRGVLRRELQSALDNTNICTFIYYPKKRMISVSEKAMEMYQTPPVLENIPESYMNGYVYPDDRESFKKMYDEIAAGAESASTVFRSINEIFQSKITLTTLGRDKEEKPVIVLGIIEDQSDEYGILKTLGQNYSAILTAQLSENRVAPRRNVTIRFAELKEFFSKPRGYDEFIEFYARELVEEDSREEFVSCLERNKVLESLKSGTPIVREYKRVSGGETHYMELRAVPYGAAESGNCMIVFRCIDDIAERRNALKYDDVTGILRKNGFFDSVSEFLKENPGKKYVMASMDLDGFSTINDTMGMAVGDRILRKIGELLSENDKLSEYIKVCGHIYADTFAALCEFPKGGEKAFMRIIFDELKAEFPKVPISLRFGFCSAEDSKIAADVYCSRANTALRFAKGNFEHHHAWFSEPMLKTHAHEQELESKMVAALNNGQFVPFFQPQYDYLTGRIVGAEALVRWFDPKKGMVPPSDFIPYFEKCGFIYKLDKCVWEQTFRLMRSWLDKGLDIPHISVNVSIRDITHEDFFDKFLALIKKHGLSPEQVHLELTESAFRDNHELQTQIVRKMKSLGFTVEMDDFGSGYSSLNSLNDIQVDVLKLDMKFIENSSGKGGNILSSVVHMANAIDIPVIAEGVEKKEQAEFLKTIGCRLMQGFYFSKPIAAENFEKLLGENGAAPETENAAAGIDSAADFLDASTQSNLLFNSFVGGAGIFEYIGGRLKVLRVNDKFFEVTDMSWESYRRFISDLLPKITPETRPAAVKMLEDAIATGKETSCCHQSAYPGNSGKCRWFYDRARCLAKKADSYIFYVSVENITERVELENKNEQLNRELQEVVRNIPDAIAKGWIDDDKKTHLQYFSPVFEKLLGYDLEEFSRINMRDPFELVCPEDLEKLSAALEETFETSKPLHLEYRLRHKNGNYVWLDVLGNCYIENGVKMIYLIYSDISEKRKKEEDLRIRESEFRSAVVQSGRMICRYTVADRAFHIYKDGGDDFGSVSEMANAPEAFIEKGIIKPESREAWLKMFAAIDRGEPKGRINELGIAKTDGGWRWYSAYFNTVETKDGKPAAAVISFEDITDTRIENKNRAFEYSGLFKALSTIYTLAVACNLTKNSYYIMEHDNFLSHSAPMEGNFDEFIEIGVNSVPEMDRDIFRKTFSRKSIMKAFASGKDFVSLEHQQYDDKGYIRRVETIVMRVEDPYDHDILQMTLSRVVG